MTETEKAKKGIKPSGIAVLFWSTQWSPWSSQFSQKLNAPYMCNRAEIQTITFRLKSQQKLSWNFSKC